MDENRLTQLFERALKLTGDERQQFLDQLSLEQRQQLEPLLLADQSVEDHGLYKKLLPRDAEFEVPGSGDSAATRIDAGRAEPAIRIPERIGRYKILELIAEGGMGSVYMAEQTEPIRRQVALKVIKAGMDSTQVIARFEAERQAMAMMDHAHIAKVFDAGVTDDGMPYFVMELVHGVSITEYCDTARLNPQARLRLFVQVCRAIQHAHQKGIIHRDIKPSNVLVSQADGVPMPKVIDFGLAKALQAGALTENTLFTNFGQVLGTLEYMSPEQAEMNTRDIDTRSDVYSLGVLLYELLTGSTPIGRERLRAEGFQRIVELIRDEEALRPSLRLSDSGDAIVGISEQRATEPSRLSSIVSGDLDWIAMKSLEKDRARRYDGPAELADEVERYLNHEPIEARPPSLSYQLQKTYHRHQLAFVATAALLTLLVAGLISAGALWLRARSAETDATNQAVEADRQKNAAVAESKKTKRALQQVEEERNKATAAQRETETALARSNYRLAVTRRDAGLFDDALKYLERIPPKHRNIEWGWLRNELDGRSINCFGHCRTVTGLAFSPDGKWLASAARGEPVRLWNAETGEFVRLVGKSGFARYVAFSPSGEILATGTPKVRFYEPHSGQEVRSFAPNRSEITSLAFSPDGEFIATGSPTTFGVQPIGNGAGRTFSNPSRFSETPTVSFSADGKTAALQRFFVPYLWDLRKRLPPQPFGHTGYRGLCYSPDGRTLAWFDEHRVRLGLLNSNNTIRTLRVPGTELKSIEFSPDGRTVATLTEDGCVRLWNLAGLAPIAVLGQLGRGGHIRYSPDSRQVALSSGSRVQIVTLPHEDHSIRDMVTPKASTIAVSQDGSLVAACFSNPGGPSVGRIVLNEPGRPTSRREFEGLDRRIHAAVFRHQGQELVCAAGPDVYSIQTASGAKSLIRSGGNERRGRLVQPAATDILRIAATADGRWLALGQRSGVIELNDENGGCKLIDTGHKISALALSATGDVLVAAGTDSRIRVFDSATGDQTSELKGDASCLAMSNDGQLLAAGSPGTPISVHTLGDATVVQLLSHPNLHSLQFTRDGRRLLSAGGFNVRLSDLGIGELLVEFSQASGIRTAFLDSDESAIHTANVNGELREWSVETPTLMVALRHRQEITFVSLNADGTFAYTEAGNERKVWNLPTLEVCPGAPWEPADTAAAASAKYAVAHTGKALLLLNCGNDCRPEVDRPGPEDSAKWHRYQAVVAENEKNWFAATFHRAWQLKYAPQSNLAYQKLHEAHEKLLASDNPLPPAIAAAALAVPEPGKSPE